MKRKMKSGSGIWQYLESTGLLENGTQEELDNARKQYWREYRRKWRQNTRTPYTVSLTVGEAKELTRAARLHHSAPTSFIRQALFAYIHSSFVVPDTNTVQDIRLLLTQNYLVLQKILECGDIRSDRPDLLHQMARLEDEVLHRLLRPESIEVQITKAIANNPACKERLLAVLQSGTL